MPLFTYEGTAHSLRVHGQTLTRGTPTELTGDAAKVARAYMEKHSDLVESDGSSEKPAKAKGGAKSSGSAKALEERQALVARAKELGIPAKGKSDELKAAIAEAEAKTSSSDQG